MSHIAAVFIQVVRQHLGACESLGYEFDDTARTTLGLPSTAANRNKKRALSATSGTDTADANQPVPKLVRSLSNSAKETYQSWTKHKNIRKVAVERSLRPKVRGLRVLEKLVPSNGNRCCLCAIDMLWMGECECLCWLTRL